MRDELLSRIVNVLVGFYALLTLAWVAAFGWHVGGLMAYRPEADRAALLVLVAGPFLWALCQPLGQRRYLLVFVRTGLATAAFGACFAVGSRGHAPVLDAPVVAGFSVAIALLGVMSCFGVQLLSRLRGNERQDRFRLTRHFRFCIETLVYGLAAAGLAHVFVWRARVERPLFDPIDYPNSYSRAMDFWTCGVLLYLLAGALYLCWRAWRLRQVWRRTLPEEVADSALSCSGYVSNPEPESVR